MRLFRHRPSARRYLSPVDARYRFLSRYSVLLALASFVLGAIFVSCFNIHAPDCRNANKAGYMSHTEHLIDDELGKQLSLRIQELAEENVRLKDSLAIYNVLEKQHVSSQDPVRINYLSAKLLRDGVYEYHLLLARDSSIDQRVVEKPVSLKFVATVSHSKHLYPVPIKNSIDTSQSISFRYFHKLDGQFVVEGAAKRVKSLTVFVYSGRHIVASQTFSL